MSRPLRILVTGSREWARRDDIRIALVAAPVGSTVLHGAARGADKMAGDAAKELGLTVEEHPADWDRYGLKVAGVIRNTAMVATSPDVCLAFGDTRGTVDCIGKARKAGIPVFVHPIPKDWPKRLEQQPTQPQLPGME
jgi:hypothetical protein